MKNKGLIIITVLITATVLLAAGIIYHQKEPSIRVFLAMDCSMFHRLRRTILF